MKNRNLADIGLLLLRLSFGFMMIYGHGWGKFMRFFGDWPPKFGNPIGVGPLPSLMLATFAEFICSILIIIGFYTRLASIPLVITMAVAAFIVHIDDGFRDMEKALLFLVGFATLYFTGAGNYSLDAQLRKKS